MTKVEHVSKYEDIPTGNRPFCRIKRNKSFKTSIDSDTSKSTGNSKRLSQPKKKKKNMKKEIKQKLSELTRKTINIL